MKTIDNIPTSKIQRATKMVQTGAKVGVNCPGPTESYESSLANSILSLYSIR